jgi:hypothetical protein
MYISLSLSPSTERQDNYPEHVELRTQGPVRWLEAGGDVLGHFQRADVSIEVIHSLLD